MQNNDAKTLPLPPTSALEKFQEYGLLEQIIDLAALLKSEVENTVYYAPDTADMRQRVRLRHEYHLATGLLGTPVNSDSSPTNKEFFVRDSLSLRLAMLVYLKNKKMAPISMGLTSVDEADLNKCFDPKYYGGEAYKMTLDRLCKPLPTATFTA